MINQNQINQIFIEETQEILERIDLHLEKWQKSPSEKAHLIPLMHDLHTLKGNARMVGLIELSEYIHALEKKIQQNDTNLLSKINVLGDIRRAISHFKQETYELKEKIGTKKKSNSSIRIKSSLLKKISELSIEVNVARKNLEQQLQSTDAFLIEITKQVRLIREEIRQSDRLEDNQIIQNVEEKLNALENINLSAMNTMRDSQKILTTQKRDTNCLEETIMHTRLVSINHFIPRLERLVQQISHELNKEVQLHIVKIEGEIDRNILENLMGPLEHMIRNAIDHGIEYPDVRRQLGKPTYGVITFSMYQQANEIVIELKDDGQGMDVEKIAKKAIEEKLWKKNTPMLTNDAVQIACLNGFTTKEIPSTLSGHGIGLNSVHTEINKMGGIFRINTKYQKGMQFSIRIPFTFSLNQVLVFKLSAQFYALRLSALSGLMRMPLIELKDRIESKKRSCFYLNQEYKLFFLNELMDGASNSQYFEPDQKVPILFLHSEEYHIGLIVDKLIGSREIIIKPPGPQLQYFQTVSGVSILEKGKILLVLEAQCLILKAKEKKADKT